jgi:hypothetical protein
MDTIPLTVGQKMRLLVDCLPLLFFSAVAVAYVTVFKDVYGGTRAPVLLFFAIVLLVTGHRTVQRVRDVALGVALVNEDRLTNILGRGHQRRRRNRHAGEFAALGRLSLTPASFRQAERGRRHRVVYSPASRIAWSVEPLP